MLHHLYPTNVIVDGSENVPVRTDTTVQGPSVADVGVTCNNESRVTIVGRTENRTVQAQSPNDVSSSEDDLARAIHYYNECCEYEDREDAGISAMLMDGGTLSLSCNKSLHIMSPKGDKKKLKVDVETKVQCPSESDFCIESEKHVVETLEMDTQHESEDDEDVCLVSNYDSEIHESFYDECFRKDVLKSGNKNEHLGYELSPKVSVMQTCGQATSNPDFDIPRIENKISMELKEYFKKRKKSPPSDESVCDNCYSPRMACEPCKPFCPSPEREPSPPPSPPSRPPPRPSSSPPPPMCDNCCSPRKACEPCRPFCPSPEPKPSPPPSLPTRPPRPSTSPPSPELLCDNCCPPRKACEPCRPFSPSPEVKPSPPPSPPTRPPRPSSSPPSPGMLCDNCCPPRKACEPCRPFSPSPEVKPSPQPSPPTRPPRPLSSPPSPGTLCDNCCPPIKPCEPCKPFSPPPKPKPSPPPSTPPRPPRAASSPSIPAVGARVAAKPHCIKVACPPKAIAPVPVAPTCGHLCQQNSSCCNQCCKTKSEPADGRCWVTPSATGYGGDMTYPQNYANCDTPTRDRLWLWILLCVLGVIGLLLLAFGIGYLVGNNNNNKKSDSDSDNQSKSEAFLRSKKEVEKPSMERISLDSRHPTYKNDSGRRNLPTVKPYVKIPFKPNSTWVRPQWTWRCVEKRCQRLAATSDIPQRSLHTCNMLCDTPKLWPRPTVSMSIATAVVPVRAEQFSLEVLSAPSQNVRRHLISAFQLLQIDLVALEKNLTMAPEIELGPPRAVLVRVAIKGDTDVRMKVSTDESYRLSMSITGDLLTADVRASSFCGARHAFETLSQIVWAEPAGATLLALEAVDIKDTPRFKYRGLLLDTSQHYLNVTEILRTIDGMGANKLNTFHWHVSDSQSFPLRLNSVPQLAEYGSFGPHAVYTTDDVSAIVSRARLRGVRVILEVDLPNAGRAWNWTNETDMGVLAYCVDAQPWENFCNSPPCGHLNPSNTRIYDILEKIYREIIDLTGVDDIFHLGWSGNPKKCWQQYVKHADVMKIWFDFAKLSLDALKRANGGMKPKHTIIWYPVMVNKNYIKWMVTEDLSMQVWNTSRLTDLKQFDLRTILSPWDMYYLDCRTFINCNSTVTSWQDMYNYRPWAGHSLWRVLGGEVCLWNQAVDLDRHLWPKGMVLAERLWSDPTTNVDSEVYLRLDLHRSRLLIRGIGSDPTWHSWCTYNPHDCVSP